MKNLMEFKHIIYLFFVATSLMLFQSCVVYNPNNMRTLSVEDIVRMSKDGVSSRDIIREMRKSHTAYLLKADQLAKLRDDGVQDSVINYMEKTHFDVVRQNQRMQDSYYWWPGYDGYMYGGFGFGWPYGYWGWNWGPAIIFRGGEFYRGGFHGGYHSGGGLRGGGRR